MVRSERRSRRGAGSQRGSSTQAASTDISLLDAPTALSPRERPDLKVAVDAEEVEASSTKGISILKEIFPEHDVDADNGPGKVPLLQQLLGGVPSPARSPTYGNSGTQPGSVPFGPPAHAPMPMVAPVMPPPPPVLPAPVCQDPWESARATAPPLPEPSFGSYRERLRAGGRGAFQRAFDAGLMPSNMKQEWNTMQMPSASAQGMLSQSQEVQSGSTMQYGAVGDAHQMWSGAGQMQSNDYCGVPMQAQYQCVQQANHTEMQMTAMSGQQLVAPVSMQQSQMPMQMLPQMAVQQPVQMVQMQQGEQSPQMSQMQMAMPVPQMSLPQMQLPQMVQTPTTSSGDSTPTESDLARRECMAILMPQASQFQSDTDLLEAQLKACAECQRYED